MRPRTCPLAAARAPSPWLDEVDDTFAVMRETKGAMSFEAQTGREPHRWDVEAMRLITRVGAAVSRSDDAIRRREEEERKAREGKR